MHTLIKIIKDLLWLVFIFLVVWLFVWAYKYEWTTKDYVRFLNSRDRNEVCSKITIKKPSTVWYLFFDKSSTEPTSDLTQTWSVENIVLSGVELTWSDSKDIKEINIYDSDLDEELEEWFDQYFDEIEQEVNQALEEKEIKEEGNEPTEEFGFKKME